MCNFIGNTKIHQYFSKIDGNSQLGHAYGFAGLNQVGKLTLAKIAAAKLLGVTIEKLASSPDFYFVERAVDEKTGKLKQDISVEQARDVKDILLRRPWLGGYQVVIIDEIEHLNKASANSLLKFLEEPASKSIIFIITEDESKLLPTVRSRCQWWRFNPVAEAEIATGLRERGIDASVASEVAVLASGRPGRALDLAQSPEKLALIKAEVVRYENLRIAPVHERFKTIESLAGEKKGATRGKDELDEILQIWTTIERKKMLLAIGASQNQSVKVIDGLTKLREYLGKNIHPRLALEEFSLNLPIN
ncbi:MAG: hypothetical protein A3J93_03795 [Candidatus Magasanikbacteria bacterium RIFOXYC2_FULL_42_28]|uniref:AAA+ ATPase domain-containing protein n=1 Tax=Candidatus Magasanikbacteria bacterium RIFOXYC2_FULL_42_28 TaxID=1798704 RepID=A0A1F6NUL3_9BACT|nr:MAG: hypothetical protein A3J93_03795 [Candidatus Magasanikbacteria bacterium RIFOXYC2_FULL_42_28]